MSYGFWCHAQIALSPQNQHHTLRGIQTIPTIDQYMAAEADPSDASNKSIIKLWKLNELAFEDIILSINHTTNQGKTAFHLVDNSVTPQKPDGNCKIAWQKLTQKYLPKTAPSYIKLKKSSQIARWETCLPLLTNGSANWKV